MTHSNRPRRSLSLAVVLLLFLGVVAPPAIGKEILKGVEPSENRVYIRTDGLACYFCAYGLERFFKKTGRIAAFGMDMEAGIVEAVFVRGEPLVSSQTLARFVHDAGFTPRWIEAELVGGIEIGTDGWAFLRLRETGERIPLDDTSALRAYRETSPRGARVVRIRGRAGDAEGYRMRVAPTTILSVVESWPR